MTEPRLDELAQRWQQVQDRIALACAAAGRDPHSITVLAVTKTYSADDVRSLATLGIRDVAENRDQEAAPKATACADLSLRWHFVGQLQTNKVKSVVRYASAVHSVDRPGVVEALARAAEARATVPLDVLIQVSPELASGRGGVPLESVAALAEQIARHDSLRLRGLMTVAPRVGDPAPTFAAVAAAASALRRDHPEAQWLSAGMSGDLEAAIRAGATHVRLGRAILGNRPSLG